MMKTTHFRRRSILALTALIGACLTAAAGQAAEPGKAEIDTLKESLSKYQDYKAAIRDLYLS
ncbi:MAG: hypothetical protein E5X55_37800, partial [Mesorhizobium sp.]